jgi:hypothetical protein
MIAAGHPDLIFQLDLYSANQPPHWRLQDEAQNQQAPKDPNYGVRLWAVGQAVQLREALDRLARRARSDKWPEFSEYDCFSCHHSVYTNGRGPNASAMPNIPDSWRQQRDCALAVEERGASANADCGVTKQESSWPRKDEYYDRIGNHPTFGAPLWNSAHYSIFLILAKEVDATATVELVSKLKAVYEVTAKLNSPAAKVADDARQAREKADTLVTAINKTNFDKKMAANLLQKISSAGDSISYQDTRSAEQAYMALDSLFRCYDGIKSGGRLTTGAHPSVGVAIEALYSEFDNPSAYNAPKFAAGMRRVNEAIRNAGIVTRASR